jgi:HKD family nuclease
VRDSNPFYAGYYRTYIRHFGLGEDGWMKNPFGDNGPEVSIRNYLRLLNFKANHRKVLITDQGAMISSSNPHDGSSYHSNIALQFKGEAVKYLLEAEKSVAAFSGTKIKVEYLYNSGPVRRSTEVLVLTEDEIRDKILENIKDTKEGDRIDLGMFYLSHREIIKQLIQAADRGVDIRVILDPNKDAFGFEKNGIPNRQAAAELLKKSDNKIQVRWYLTHGEQFHTKVIAVHKKSEAVLIGGSANYTRRNLDKYNLEADLMVTVKEDDPLAKGFTDYFDRIWENRDGVYTGDFSEYADDSLWKVFVYRFQEKTGLCTF